MSITKAIDLKNTLPGHSKEYHMQLKMIGPNGIADNAYAVYAQWGAIGSTLRSEIKIEGADFKTAEKKYEKILSEKLSKGYEIYNMSGSTSGYTVPVAGSAYSLPAEPKKVAVVPKKKQTNAIPYIVTRKIDWQDDEIDEPCTAVPTSSVLLPQLLNPIDESELEKYLKDDNWGAQEKKDGRHQMICYSSGMKVYNKKGKEIGFPSAWETAMPAHMIIDGEAIGEVFHAFDMLELEGIDYRKNVYLSRYTLLESEKFGADIKVVPLITGYQNKKDFLKLLQVTGKEGIVFKNLNSVYTPGRPSSGGDMVKFKFYAEASVRVAAKATGKHSVALEIIKDSVWTPIGNVTIGPSTPLPPVGSVIEVRYLYAYKGGSLYQPTFKEIRTDVDDTECLIEQLKYKAEE